MRSFFYSLAFFREAMGLHLAANCGSLASLGMTRVEISFCIIRWQD